MQLKVGLGAGKGGFAHSFDFEDSTVGHVAILESVARLSSQPEGSGTSIFEMRADL
ncbi:hypothetical protein IH879_00310 [candidate division KSB1 bacterium]|nr:hypothetical protein [candidate division KSB1 bacterium]